MKTSNYNATFLEEIHTKDLIREKRDFFRILRNTNWNIKGQLILKCLFGIFYSAKKWTKNITLLLWYLSTNCLPTFFGRYQKDISKLFNLEGKAISYSIAIVESSLSMRYFILIKRAIQSKRYSIAVTVLSN